MGAIRRGQLVTHVEGNLAKALDLAMSGRVSALSFSPKSNFLAVSTATTLHLCNETGTRKLLIWDALKQPVTPFVDRPPLRATLAFSPDGRQLFFCGAQGLEVWKWADGPSVEQNPTSSWKANDVYNLAIVDENHVACATKKGSNHVLQLRNASDGSVLWEKNSGLLPITALWSRGTTIRSIVGSPTGSQAYWSEWQVSDGKPSLPVDLGNQNAFAVSFAPDGGYVASVSRSHITTTRDSLALNIIALDSGEAKVATAPKHPLYAPYRYRYRYYWPDSPYWWPEDGSVDNRLEHAVLARWPERRIRGQGGHFLQQVGRCH